MKPQKTKVIPQAFCILCITWEGMKSYSLCGEEARTFFGSPKAPVFHMLAFQLLGALGCVESQGTTKNRIN